MSDGQTGLPPGWAQASLGEVTEFVTSGSRGWAAFYSEDGPLFLRVGNLDRGTVALDLSSIQRVSPPEGAEGRRTSVMQNDILLSITADVGMVGHVPADLGEAYINQHIALIRPVDGIDSRCLAWSLTDPDGLQKVVREEQYGVTKASLSLVQVRGLGVPIPPLNEQKRIVAQIEALQARSSAAQEALDAIPPLLEKFRQSVLAAAFRGDLTKKWREAHPDTEPATELLARIRAERRRRWEEANPKKKYVEPEPVDTQAEGLHTLPKGWAWARWADLSEWVTYGFTRPMPHVESGVPIVTAKNVTNGGLDLSAVHFTTQDAFDALSDKDRPHAGDILITKDGTIGRAAVVPPGARFCINQSVAVVYLRSCPIDRAFLLAAIRAPFTQRPILEAARGMAIQHLSITDFARLPVPIAPEPEVQALVAKLEAMELSQAVLRQAYAGLVGSVPSLNQSILAKAFRGELVPQDPNDEPASVLLERIRQERDVHEATTEKPRRGRKPKPAQ